MSTLEIILPNSVCERVEQFAREEGGAVDDYPATVISQRIAVVEADSYIRRRGSKGSAGGRLETLKGAPTLTRSTGTVIQRNKSEFAISNGDSARP